MPYEYMWGLSMDQRGTTDLTMNTAFIHMMTSITAYITSQCMVGQPFISRYSLWRELITISFININYIIKYAIIINNNPNNSSLNIIITIWALIYTLYDTYWKVGYKHTMHEISPYRKK